MDMTSNKDAGPRKALGRGLAALIPTAATVGSPSGLRSVAIEKIHPNRAQPRKHFDETALAELAASMEERGVLQPIIVRRQGDGFELVAGERRWRAAQKAGLQEVPAIVKELSDSDALQVALIENLQREDLDPLEEAEALSRLIREHALSQDRVAEAVGKSRAAVANSLRLLKLPAPILEMLAAGRLTAGHARALMTVGAEEAMVSLAHAVVERGLSVREAEHQARLIARAAKVGRKIAKEKTPAVVDVEEKLQRAFGTKVRLHERQGKGRIETFFHSYEQLNGILDRAAR